MKSLKVQFFFKYWAYPSLSKIVNSSVDIQHTQNLNQFHTWEHCFLARQKSHMEITLKCKIQFFPEILRIPLPNKNCE